MKTASTLLSGVCLLLAACNTPSFVTSNNVLNQPAVVHMLDGRQLKGDITLVWKNLFSLEDYIRYVPQGSSDRYRIKIAEMKGYETRGDFYVPKNIQSVGWGNRSGLAFVKRLTRENSRIQFYELLQATQNTNTFPAGPREDVDFEYFISLPEHDRYTTLNLDRQELSPRFNEKMSEYLKDCPALAEKIREKEKGYAYAMVSLSRLKRIETVMNIIDEYDACK
jgi:hypothetical protein